MTDSTSSPKVTRPRDLRKGKKGTNTHPPTLSPRLPSPHYHRFLLSILSVQYPSLLGWQFHLVHSFSWVSLSLNRRTDRCTDRNREIIKEKHRHTHSRCPTAVTAPQTVVTVHLGTRVPARAPALQTGLLLPPSLPLLACMVGGFFLLIYVAVVLLRAMGMIVGVLGAASIPGERAVVLPGEIMADMVAMAAVMVVVMAVVMAAVVDVEVVIMEGEAGMAVTVVCCGSCSPVVWTVTD